MAAIGGVLAVSACGQVTIDETVAPDVAGQNDGTVGEVAAPQDNGPVDTAKAGCTKELECANMKGKTPCNLPSCEVATGKCVLKQREAGEACVNELDLAGECELATCTAEGECKKNPKADGAKCGTNVCGKKCAAGQCVSTTGKDYDDKNPCTQDYCDQGNEVKHDPLTGLEYACDDGDKCSTDDICVGGQCKGQPLVCNDSVPCTFDSCDKATGCVHLPDNKKCADLDPCMNTACLPEGCTLTTPKLGNCDDNNPCTVKDQCDKGVCKGKANTVDCGCASDSDCGKYSDPCKGKFKCNGLTKVCELDPETVVKCPPASDGCSTNACDATTGKCVAKPANDGKDCDDNNLCTQDTKCAGGNCKGPPKDCDDKNVCTLDSCNPKDGCSHDPAAGACDDGNKCTQDDVCTLAGVCAGVKKSCDDGVACTYESCDDKTGECSSSPQDKLCDDKNPCTTDTCGATGCSAKADDTGKCDDGNACTTDACVNGACKSQNTCQCQGDADCNDDNSCTVDKCDTGKCSYTDAPPTQGCDSDNKCMEPNSGTCEKGVCAGGKPKTCAGDTCNSATCNPTSGQCESVPKADGTGCDADGNGCTANDSCKSGKCTAGPQATCISTDCAAMTCKSTGANTFTCDSKPEPNGKTCDDGLFCTSGDACNGGGKCVGKPLDCAAPLPGKEGPGLVATPCAPVVCNESIKACESKPLPAGSDCDDGKFCTAGDKCNADGACVGGAPPICKAAGVCAVGFCDESLNKCSVAPKPGCCTSNAECDDGKPCTTDTCNTTGTAANTCSHAPTPNCCNQQIFAESFDDGSAPELTIANSVNPTQGWQIINQNQCVPVTMCMFPSPPFALYYGDAPVGNFNFGNSNGTVTLPVLNAPPAAGAALTMKLNFWYDTEQGNFYDALTISAIDANCVASPCKSALIWQKDQGMAPKTWLPLSLNVGAALAGMNLPPSAPFKIEIKFETKDAVGNEGFGILIDGIVIEGPPCGPPSG